MKINSNFKQIPKGWQATDIGLIPEDWDWIKLGDEKCNPILELRNGLTDPQTENESNYRVTRIETISNESIDLERTKYIEIVSDEKVYKYRIRRGDILFSHINSDPHIGKSAIAKRDYPNLLHGLNLLLFRTNGDILSPEFLNYIFNYYRSIGIFIKICSRAVNQSSINQGKLKSLFIPLPPLPEQKKIAHILSKIQQAIEIQEQIIKTTQELKKALMQKLFTEGLNGEPQKQTEIGPVPKSWEVALIKDYGIVKSNSFSFTKISTIDSHKNEDDKVLAIKVSDMNLPGNESILINSNIEFHVSKSNLMKLKPIPIHSIIFPKRGAAISTNKKRMNNQLVILDPNLIAIIPNQAIIPKYLFYWFLTFDIGRLKDDNPIPQLNKKDVDNVKFPLPQKIEEQNEIINILDSISVNLDCQISKRSSLRDLFKSNLNLLMTGQIRVKEIEFDIEESINTPIHRGD